MWMLMLRVMYDGPVIVLGIYRVLVFVLYV